MPLLRTGLFHAPTAPTIAAVLPRARWYLPRWFSWCSFSRTYSSSHVGGWYAGSLIMKVGGFVARSRCSVRVASSLLTKPHVQILAGRQSVGIDQEPLLHRLKAAQEKYPVVGREFFLTQLPHCLPRSVACPRILLKTSPGLNDTSISQGIHRMKSPVSSNIAVLFRAISRGSIWRIRSLMIIPTNRQTGDKLLDLMAPIKSRGIRAQRRTQKRPTRALQKHAIAQKIAAENEQEYEGIEHDESGIKRFQAKPVIRKRTHWTKPASGELLSHEVAAELEDVLFRRISHAPSR